MTPADAARLAEIRAMVSAWTRLPGEPERTNEFLLRLLDEGAPPREAWDLLFDGYAVLEEARRLGRRHATVESVPDVLSAIVSLARKRGEAPPPPEIAHGDAGGSPEDLAQGEELRRDAGEA